MGRYRATRSCALIAPLQCISSPVAITPSCPHQYDSLFFFWTLFAATAHTMLLLLTEAQAEPSHVLMLCSMHRSLSTKSQRSSFCGARNAR
jgi:hypothetical protein